MENLAKRIETILFIRGEPVAVEKLAKLLGSDKTKIREAAEELDQKLIGTALTLVWSGDFVQLATRPAMAKDAEGLIKEEISREISSAAAETLAVISYRSPIMKSEIDYIRGVNSSYTLRGLLIRGLIERKTNPKDARTYIYQASIDFLKFLGISRIEDLPQYAESADKFKQFLTTMKKENL
ncbi:MAG: SMC-Scp complex subunit ScpB [Candidatus Niyogibacteria bacterium]|nr:SMC-Scp complex subunit ScpB [Candidatus Niyogibacteria bacterium]